MVVLGNRKPELGLVGVQKHGRFEIAVTVYLKRALNRHHRAFFGGQLVILPHRAKLQPRERWRSRHEDLLL